jgi:hypothetical protein
VANHHAIVLKYCERGVFQEKGGRFLSNRPEMRLGAIIPSWRGPA